MPHARTNDLADTLRYHYTPLPQSQRVAQQRAMTDQRADASTVSVTNESALIDKLLPHNRWYWLLFFTLGLLNNFHYVIVLASAQSLAAQLAALPMIGFIAWATVFLGLVSKIAHTLVLLRTSVYYRMLTITVIAVVGLVGLSLATQWGFVWCIVFISLIGVYSAVGESILLGYLKHFRPSLIGAFSSGTGCAGIVGTGVYLLLASIIKLSNAKIFLTIVPTCALYFLAFRYIYHSALAHQQCDELLGAGSNSIANGSESAGVTGTTMLTRIVRISRLIYSYILNLTLVYFLEYCIIVAFASVANQAVIDRINTSRSYAPSDREWWQMYSYEILNFLYQFGVLLSRSSIDCVRIPHLTLLTALQLVNFLLWFCQCYIDFLPLYLQFVHMVFVGLMGGASYVNCFYSVRNDGAIEDSDRELAINVVASSYYVGIIGSSVFDIVALNTILSR